MLRIEQRYSGNAVRTAESHREHTSAVSVNTDTTVNERPFLKINYRKSFGYGSGYGYKYDSENIKKKQINKAPMERWGMLELIKRSGIELSRVEKENLLIFGDIRGYEWADYERQKLNYEFDSGGD